VIDINYFPGCVMCCTLLLLLLLLLLVLLLLLLLLLLPPLMLLLLQPLLANAPDSTCCRYDGVEEFPQWLMEVVGV
jgi:hypothetical protein